MYLSVPLSGANDKILVIKMVSTVFSQCIKEASTTLRHFVYQRKREIAMSKLEFEQNYNKCIITFGRTYFNAG